VHVRCQDLWILLRLGASKEARKPRDGRPERRVCTPLVLFAAIRQAGRALQPGTLGRLRAGERQRSDMSVKPSPIGSSVVDRSHQVSFSPPSSNPQEKYTGFSVWSR